MDLLALSLVLGTLVCGSMSVTYNVVWFRASRPMVHVVMRHLHRDGEHQVAAGDKTKIWDPSRPLGPENTIQGEGKARYSLDGDLVLLELSRPPGPDGLLGAPERFEGIAPDTSVRGNAQKPITKKAYRAMLFHFTAQQVVPALGWLVGALLGRETRYEPLITGPIGWLLAGFLTIVVFHIALAVGSFKDLSDNRLTV
jgi:hypothetical protein